MYPNDCDPLTSGEEADAGGAITLIADDTQAMFPDNRSCYDFKQHLLMMSSMDDFTKYQANDGNWAWGLVGDTGISIWQGTFSESDVSIAETLLHEARHNAGETHPFDPTDSEASDLCGLASFAPMHQLAKNFVSHLTQLVTE